MGPDLSLRKGQLVLSKFVDGLTVMLQGLEKHSDSTSVQGMVSVVPPGAVAAHLGEPQPLQNGALSSAFSAANYKQTLTSLASMEVMRSSNGAGVPSSKQCRGLDMLRHSDGSAEASTTLWKHKKGRFDLQQYTLKLRQSASLLLRGREMHKRGTKHLSATLAGNRTTSRIKAGFGYHGRGGALGVWSSKRARKLSGQDKLLTQALLALVLECFTDLARYPRCVSIWLHKALTLAGDALQNAIVEVIVLSFCSLYCVLITA